MSSERSDDVTVLRSDPSISTSFSAEGSGEADAPRVLKQRFVLEEKLGSGGMGTVFRAKDLRKVEARDRQPYLAIKVLNNDFREHPEAFIALQREAAKSQTLSHPNIVSIFDFDKDADVPFITMELLEGQELAQLIRSYPNGLPEAVAWPVIRGICAGLRHAHAAGIVHADFKPGNVFVAPDNSAKILDFGIARAVQMTETHGEDTLFDPARLAALTPAYASREMLAGDNPEERDDLYSLGIVVYLMLSGHHPYGRLSAEEAAREGLKPEKPKGLSRRQWQVIRRCLSFNRQDRPEDMAEVERLLLTPSPWPVRGALATAAILLLALSVNYFMGDAERREVEQEVRQTTLLDAQLERLDTLLEAPVFDDNWETQVARELDGLVNLHNAEESASEVADRIAGRYALEIAATEDLDRALTLMERARRYGPLTDSAETLQQAVVVRIQHLLDEARPDGSWLADLKAELNRLERAFPDSHKLAELEIDVGDTLELLLAEALDAGQVDEAELLLSELSQVFYDVVELEELRRDVADARAQAHAAEQARALAEVKREQLAALDTLLSASCLRIDVAALAALNPGRLGAAATERVAARLGDCLVQLAELDPDRATLLKREISQGLPDAINVADISMDPCALGYLVGNGAQLGRRGYCSDSVTPDQQGPRLVVIPEESGAARFAITKEEISWSQFLTFCVDRDGCSQRELDELQIDERLPVTRVSADTARAFARWLSDSTGYTYRLPTAEEWRRAAQGDPDPNRNCQVKLDGVERGLAPVAAEAGQSNDFGLLNTLGNVQEWVVDGERLVAVGGSFADPINLCAVTTIRDHAGAPAPDTGFRLVRELT